MNNSFLDREEINLYLKDIRNDKSKPMSKEEEDDVVRRIKEGDQEAKEQLILHNVRFVISVAKEFQNQGLELNDLINEGNYGLIKAAEKYDWENSNVKFISYAVWWIKQAIRDSLNKNGRLIRVPVNKIGESYKLKKENRDIENDEVADELGIPIIDSSLNDEIDEGTELGDIIESDDYLADAKDDSEREYEIKKEINNCIDVLDNREKTIILAYFGLDEENIDSNDGTLEQIKEVYFPDLSKERIRQHKIQAIRKLRDNAHNLIKYLENN